LAKVTINGEVFAVDFGRRSMYEALVIEEELHCKLSEWEQSLSETPVSAKAMAAVVWLVWHRDGRETSLRDILTGKADVELTDLNIEAEGQTEPDPTSPAPDPSSSTGVATSASSRKSSGSGRGSSST
jgi:hypothetical protein